MNKSGQPLVDTVVICGLLVFQALLLAWGAFQNSPGIDEVGHLAAGVHHWKTGTFDLYRVNPPLVRVVATSPVVAWGIDLPDKPTFTSPPVRPEFELGRKLVDREHGRVVQLFAFARLACIPFAVLGTFVVFIWGNELYGRGAGLLSATLWVICPNSIANALMITPDTGAAALGLLSCYCFSKWLRRPEIDLAVVVGIVLGIAQLTKTTLVLLYPVWTVIWIAYSQSREKSRRWLGFWHLLLIYGVSLFTINAGYGFEDTCWRIGEIRFSSKLLSVGETNWEKQNRFAGTWIGQIPVPLPRNYVQGIDVQKRDFEAGMESYLRGQWRTVGWLDYYVYALLIKTPLGTLAVFVLAIISCFFRSTASASWRDECVLLVPSIAILAFISSQTGFNHHSRYVLPALPFLFIWMGRVAAYAGPRPKWWRSAIGVAATASVVSSLSIYPHSMSYFNELVGGPLHGSEHLLDSNIDWGQDLLYLKRWLDDHPQARPIGFAYFGYVDPRAFGIEFHLPPDGLNSGDKVAKPEDIGPRPGWFAISVSTLRGNTFPIPDGRGGMKQIRGWNYDYFLKFKPVAYAGYSIWIYHIELDECDRVRQELGLPRRPDS